jgi:tetratricopeptide (TPR) repeat protein
MKNTAQIFNEALSALNSGDFRAAEKGFRKVVRLDGTHVPALNLLTVVLMSSNRFSEAEPLIAKAVTLNKTSDVSFYNYGLISKNLKKPHQALEQFTKALELNPNAPETWNNRGTIFNDLKKYDYAIDDFNRAITLNQAYVDAYANKAKSLAELKRYDEALAAYDKALSLKPDLAEASLGRGNVFVDLRRFDNALEAYDKALSFKPDLAGAWLGRGNAFAGLKRHDEALAAYDKALSLWPALAEAWLGRGNVFAELKRHDEALAAYDKALSLKPDLAGVWFGYGNVFTDLNRYNEAIAAYDKAIVLDPHFAASYLHKGLVKLTLSDFAAGWDLYEWRFQTPEFYALAQELQNINVKARQGRQELSGKNIVVLAEQGVGDEIMFASTIADLAVDARSVAYECDPRLTPLFERSFPGVTFFKRDDHRTSIEPPSDIVLKAGSLPYAYRRDAASFPKTAYLKPNPSRVAHWTDRLNRDANSKKKIGISWRGGTARTRLNDRSLDIQRLTPFIDTAGTYFVSLQYGDVRDEIGQFNGLNPNGQIHCPLDDIDNFDELAALVAALDLVISVQNTTIHLCGALGTPCWGMIAWRPEWRYGSSRDDMAWYPSVRLYRQHQVGDWNSVLEPVLKDLQRITLERPRV